MLTTILKSFHTLVFIATTSKSITFSPTGIGLILIPISTRIACTFKNSNEVIYETVYQK